MDAAIIRLQEVIDELEAVLIFQRMKKQNASNRQIAEALNEFEAKIGSGRVWRWGNENQQG